MGIDASKTAMFFSVFLPAVNNAVQCSLDHKTLTTKRFGAVYLFEKLDKTLWGSVPVWEVTDKTTAMGKFTVV